MEKRLNGGSPPYLPYHHRKTDDAESPGRHDPHTHVVLPGTYYDDGMAERVPLYFSRNKSVDHIEMLHRLTEQQVIDQMDRYVGADWEQRYDRLAAVREAERAVTIEPAHGTFTEDDLTIPFWCGTRQTDEQTSAAGYYRIEDDEIVFRPLVHRLDHEQAALMARLLHSELGDGFDWLKALGETVDEMNGVKRMAFFAQLREMDFSAPEREQPYDRTPNFDIDL